ncbi:hypothetical protein [Desulfoferrobacter suflitae]|uniref:hypothetical protein n=1 Tax=Desulfoferrobacter suflitae TaxID=2865782 RepID=UPI002164789B|nr:hypothetical protein [Desulfoferrobacter suflitae]MCK8600925.1 hypothetical protein [Desulfoferrobacter suflitae]
MKGYFKDDQSRGDFSTSFGDMVFGLLFFFFILTLAMVFNRSDVGSFHKEIDQLRAQQEQMERQTAKWKERHDALKQLVTSLQREQKVTAKKLKEAQEEYQQLQKEHKSIVDSFRAVNSEYNALNNKYTSLAKNNDVLLEQSAKLRKARDQVKAQLATFQDHMKKVKQLLKKKGLMDILAQVEQMEKGKKSTPKGEETPTNVYKIFTKLHPDGYSDARVLRGETEISVYSSLPDAALLEVAKDVKQLFKDEAQKYSEEEREKYQPRMFLMAHPEMQYGKLQEFLARMRKTIPVSIIPWKNN